MQHLSARNRAALAPTTLALVVLAALVALVAVATILAAGGSSGPAIAVLLVPVILVVTIPVLRRAEPGDLYLNARGVLVTGFVVKLGGALVRLALTRLVLGGDALVYDQYGKPIAAAMRAGSLHFDLGAPLLGTGFVRLLTGAVYAVFGPSMVVGYLLFAWLGFWGLYLFFKAFRVTWPDADPRWYAALLLFSPSFFFWPSSIGKEAVVTFTLGAAAYGIAKLFRSQASGLWITALGVVGTALVRPHVAVLVVAAAGLAYALGRTRNRHGERINPVVKAVVIAILAGGAFLAASNAAQFFGVQDLSLESVNQITAATNKNSSQGGSEFTAPNPQSPIEFPMAFVTVLYRPLITEAHNLASFLSAIEGTFFVVITLVSLPRIWRNLREYRRSGYLLACLFFVLAFTFFFGSIGNFGILVRQRVQVLPFFFVMLCVPDLVRMRRAATAAASAAAPDATTTAQPPEPEPYAVIEADPLTATRS